MTKAEKAQKMIDEAQKLLRDAQLLSRAKYFVFPVIVNGKGGYARIIDEKDVESWWSDGEKESFFSSTKEACLEYVKRYNITLIEEEVKEWEDESPFRN